MSHHNRQCGLPPKVKRTLDLLVSFALLGSAIAGAILNRDPDPPCDGAPYLVPHGPLGPLAGNPLTDKRVRIETRDVAITLRSSEGKFDAVLLDVDNGPAALTSSDNAWLYDDQGIAAALGALKRDGVLAVWSAREDRKFEKRLRHGGFAVRVERVRGRSKNGGPHHTIFVGRKA